MNLKIQDIGKRYRLTDQGRGPMDQRFTLSLLKANDVSDILFDRQDDIVLYITEAEYKFVIEENSLDACKMALYAGMSRSPIPCGWDVI